MKQLSDAKIPFAVYSGKHVAYLTGVSRPDSDNDILLSTDREHVGKFKSLLQTMHVTSRIEVRALIGLPGREQARKVSFYRIKDADVELKLGADGWPYYFTWSPLVEACRVPHAANSEILFVATGETLLLKLALVGSSNGHLSRPHDEPDILNIIRSAGFDDREVKAYMQQRILELHADGNVLMMRYEYYKRKAHEEEPSSIQNSK
jgi:hypothetical protein